nr:uncharacterized protein LOC111506581 [Leptinotarsa decemlineata]
MTTKKKPEERRSVPEMKNIKVPIPTFPPTAMVYSVPKSPKPERKTEEDVESAPVDIVSAAIMAKVLEERQRERVNMKHCDTCTCAKSLRIVYDNTHHTVGTQTGDYKEMLCLKCNDNVFASTASVQIVRNTDSKTNRVVPIYPLESLETTATQTSYNIVKVQPNNFLLDKSKMSSKNSSLTDSNRSSPKTDGIPNIFSKSSETLVKKNNTHRLCDKIDPNHEIELNLEKADSEKNEDKVSAKTTSPKGPRYCSMRVQTGTKNILLDNAHNNVAPILYTRSHKVAAQKEESSNTETSSEKFNSMASDTSAQNQQRVAEWIQNNLEDDISSSDNSRSELLGTKKGLKTDKVKYAEMEENVKRFLFGESEFLKTVEIGKMKYQNIRDEEKSGSKVEPCSETDI